MVVPLWCRYGSSSNCRLTSASSGRLANGACQFASAFGLRPPLMHNVMRQGAHPPRNPPTRERAFRSGCACARQSIARWRECSTRGAVCGRSRSGPSVRSCVAGNGHWCRPASVPESSVPCASLSTCVGGVDGEVPNATGNGRFRGFLTRMVFVYPRSACFGGPVGGSVSVISVSCGVRRRVHVRG